MSVCINDLAGMAQRRSHGVHLITRMADDLADMAQRSHGVHLIARMADDLADMAQRSKHFGQRSLLSTSQRSTG